MYANPWLIPTLVLAYGLFGVGRWAVGKATSQPQGGGVLALGLLLAVPGTLIALYYFHLYDGWMPFFRFRALPGTELTAAGLGFVVGLLSRYTDRSRLFSLTGLLVLLTLGILLPYAKPLLLPAEHQAFSDQWDGDVCLQSRAYSCGAASTATILHHFGQQTTEAEIARECHTCRTGTEVWYLARALRRRGLAADFLFLPRPTGELPVPSIAGVRVQGTGHFVTLLERTPTGYLVGDPLTGASRLTDQELHDKFSFTGFFLQVSRP